MTKQFIVTITGKESEMKWIENYLKHIAEGMSKDGLWKVDEVHVKGKEK